MGSNIKKSDYFKRQEPRMRVFLILLSNIFVISLLVLAGSAVTASNTTEYYQEISELAGIQFDSYDNLTEFSLRKKDIIKYEDISRANVTCIDYVLIMDSLYVPSQFINRIHEIESCLITPTYVCTSFVINDIRYQLYYYYSEISGIKQLNQAIRYFEEGLNSSGKASHNNNSIYFYERPYLNNTVESYYVWQQENKCFVLRVNTPIKKENIELCCSVSVPILANDNSTINEQCVVSSPKTYDITVITVFITTVSAIGWNYSSKKWE